MALIPSMEPVVEKAQQLPQEAWFLTGVTAPSLRQSTAAGALTSLWLKAPGVCWLQQELKGQPQYRECEVEQAVQQRSHQTRILV